MTGRSFARFDAELDGLVPVHHAAADDLELAVGELVADPGRVRGQPEGLVRVMPLAPGAPGREEREEGTHDGQMSVAIDGVHSGGAVPGGHREDELGILEQPAVRGPSQRVDSYLMAGPRIPRVCQPIPAAGVRARRPVLL